MVTRSNRGSGKAARCFQLQTCTHLRAHTANEAEVSSSITRWLRWLGRRRILIALVHLRRWRYTEAHERSAFARRPYGLPREALERAMEYALCSLEVCTYPLYVICSRQADVQGFHAGIAYSLLLQLIDFCERKCIIQHLIAVACNALSGQAICPALRTQRHYRRKGTASLIWQPSGL